MDPSTRAMPRLLSSALVVVACAAGPAAGAVRLEIDADHSEIGFLMRTTWHKVTGRTRNLSGVVTSDSGDLFADGRVTVQIEAATLDTGNRRRDRTMREKHLETAAYPTIRFASSAPPEILSTVKAASGSYREVSFRLQGDLTIHGVTRAVTMPVTARREQDGWVMSGQLPVRLSEFDIPDPSIMFNRVHDEVTVTFTVRTGPAGAGQD